MAISPAIKRGAVYKMPLYVLSVIASETWQSPAPAEIASADWSQPRNDIKYCCHACSATLQGRASCTRLKPRTTCHRERSVAIPVAKF